MGWTELYDMDREMNMHDRAREIAPAELILRESARYADWHPNERGMLFIHKHRLVALAQSLIASALLAERRDAHEALLNIRSIVDGTSVVPQTHTMHRMEGACPDPTQPDSRDPKCEACVILGIVDRTLSAQPAAAPKAAPQEEK